MKQLQILRYLIDNPQWLPKLQQELFTGPIQTIFLEAIRIQREGLTPTIPALQYKLPQLEGTLQEVSQTDPLQDETVFHLQREDLRMEAFSRLSEMFTMIDHMEQKQRDHLISRYAALNSNEEPQILDIGTDFFDYSHHIQLEGVQIDTGLKFLDTTGSGFEKGQLATILAPSNGGKSTLLGCIARNMIAKKYNVIYFAFEETRSDFLGRIGRGLLNKTSYQYAQMSESDLEQKWSPYQDKLGTLTVITGQQVAVEDLRNIIQKNESNFGITYDAVFIDYSSHMVLNSAGKNQRDDQRISDIFRGLKQYANTQGEEKIVITACQANREGYKNTLTASNAADSLGGIRESDTVLGIRLNTTENSTIVTPEVELPGRLQGIFECNVIKRRKGTLAVQSKYYYEFKASNTIKQIENEELMTQIELQGFEELNISENYLNELEDSTMYGI